MHDLLAVSHPPAALHAPLTHTAVVRRSDLGWGNVGWHRETPTPEVQTPHMNALVKAGIEMNRMYTWHACSPTRSSLQTGRLPIHVVSAPALLRRYQPSVLISGRLAANATRRHPQNAHNANPEIYNATSASGTGAGIPRNMTGMAAKLASRGYNTVFVGKW